MKITQWQHFVRNYLFASIMFIGISAWMYYSIEQEMKWFSIVPLIIGVVVIPVGNYLSWKKK